jgi:hypothetical protein
MQAVTLFAHFAKLASVLHLFQDRLKGDNPVAGNKWGSLPQ